MLRSALKSAKITLFITVLQWLSRKKIDSEAGFKPEVQCQLEVSFPPVAVQLILINVCFFWIISLVFHAALLKLD